MSETVAANELGRQLSRQMDLFYIGLLLLFVVLSIAIFFILNKVLKKYIKRKKKSGLKNKVDNKTKKIDWKGLVKKPLFWIGIWIILPIFIIFLSDVLSSELFNLYLMSSLLIIPLLCIWMIILGIFKLKKGGSRFLSIIYIALSIIILFIFYLVYSALLNPFG